MVRTRRSRETVMARSERLRRVRERGKRPSALSPSSSRGSVINRFVDSAAPRSTSPAPCFLGERGTPLSSVSTRAVLSSRPRASRAASARSDTPLSRRDCNRTANRPEALPEAIEVP